MDVLTADLVKFAVKLSFVVVLLRQCVFNVNTPAETSEVMPHASCF